MIGSLMLKAAKRAPEDIACSLSWSTVLMSSSLPKGLTTPLFAFASLPKALTTPGLITTTGKAVVLLSSLPLLAHTTPLVG